MNGTHCLSAFDFFLLKVTSMKKKMKVYEEIDAIGCRVVIRVQYSKKNL